MMKVRDLMQRHVTTIHEGEPLTHAHQLMVLSHVRHLPVLRAADDRMIGLIGERDLLRVATTREVLPSSFSRSVRDFMVTPVESVSPGADLTEAAAQMNEKKIGCLPVLQTGALVGMLTPADVLRAWAQAPEHTPVAKARPSETAVATIMYRQPIAAHEHDTVVATAARMVKQHVRHACVVDGDECVVGMISDRDVRRVLGDAQLALAPNHVPDHLRRLTVGHIMTLKPRCVDENAPVTRALAMLVSQPHVGALPVVDAHGRLCGLVSYVDVLKQLASDLERQAS